ncbi:MAG TPA: hypothetical protein VH593_32285 [Ktedonobacteraceae bacterium]|jgi:hypothetical protein
MPEIDSLNLNPQEQFLYNLHRINLLNAPVNNPDGSVSTLRQMSVGLDGKTYNIPTVWDGQVLPPDQALAHARNVGLDAFPSYPDEATANKRYDQMHSVMEKEIGQAAKPTTPQDIYPLGQGKGLLPDAINFALNNIYQYGQRTKAANQRMGQAMGDIQAGGSPDLSPLVRDVVSTSPLYTGLINWSGMTEPAKAMLQRFGRAYPNMVGAMEKAPQIMEASIAKDLPSGTAGALSKPLPSAHFMEVAPNYADNLYTIGHEMQHSLNAPRVAATNPIDALTIGTLLHDVLPAGNRGSLNTVLSKQVTGPTLFQQLFGGPAKQQLRVTNPDRNLMRNAMDEGLAYLGQNAAEGKGGDLVKKLASRLGVNWENPGVRGQ